MKELIDMLHAGGYSCVIANGDRIRTFTQRGVADLYDLLVQEPEFLYGASVADKVIGKAAASLMVLGGVREVYTRTISRPALQLLQEAGVMVTCDEVVDHIINRDRTGWCPLEQASRDLHSAKEIFPVIEKFIANLRKKA
ncbi:DUF1893 domain-containing protein [uncultured Mediterranea sp.]|uniref:DUF1893 domain-containing protein n=1 Tax=uncultured Mediterranea sp. TaxID=1926662 RepID=UPI0027D93C96|nr:DUF1893 domain-containing protein [uncultured Mediterranea sp.]